MAGGGFGPVDALAGEHQSVATNTAQQGLKSASRVRSVFPETWLWSNATVGYSISDSPCLKGRGTKLTLKNDIPNQSYIVSYLLLLVPREGFDCVSSIIFCPQTGRL